MSATILIADDEPNILLSLEFLMQREGYRVLVARDGQEALDSILQHRPDLVLLDVMMPRKSGFDVLQAMREREDLSAVRVLMPRDARSTPPRAWRSEPMAT
jgi:DNA-binding response OmpR family regulator